MGNQDNMGMMGGEGMSNSGAARPKSFQNPATVGGGLQALAAMAAKAGNELDLTQGHHELAPNFSRRPLHPGHNATLDKINRPKLNGDQFAGASGM